MQFKFYAQPDRAEFIELALEKAKIGPEDDSGLVSVTLEIESSVDLLKLFHAGISYGYELGVKDTK